MKKGCIIGLVAAGALLLIALGIYGWMKGAQNDMVKAHEEVNSAWAQVQNQYQRRLDLVPNLVGVVKGAAAHEQNTLTAVIEARAKATQVQLKLDDVNENTMKQFQQAQGELSSALSRLMMVTESYPDLKANQSFLELQAQLEGTENRISTERRKFNETCKDYNTLIRKFPNSILAAMFGFSTKPYFEADVAAQTAPKVEF